MNKLAIVIPAFKPTFLRQTLNSIAAQSNQEFHVYIGDDNSPSNLEIIVDEFRTKFRMTYVKFEKNIGKDNLVAQWNRCIDLIKEEKWIWLFSDDDIMGPDCVDNFHQYQKKYIDFDVFHFNVKVIDHQNKFAEHYKYTPFPPIISSFDLYRKKIKGQLNSYVVEYIFKRKSFDNLGGFVDFDLAWGSDIATIIKISHARGVLTIPDIYIFWRASSENITPNNQGDIPQKKLQADLVFFQWSKVFFKERKLLKYSNMIVVFHRCYIYGPFLSRDEFKCTLVGYLENEYGCRFVEIKYLLFRVLFKMYYILYRGIK